MLVRSSAAQVASCPKRHNGLMTRSSESLISQIQTDALDDQASITAALRKCLVWGAERILATA